MNSLPESKGLEISALSKAFENTSNSYKFYWFLSLLDHIAKTNDPEISYEKLSMNMLALVWYPLDFYKLSFGSDDSFKRLAEEVTMHLNIDNGINSPSLLHQLQANLSLKVHKKLSKNITVILKRYVAHRFIRPFFDESLRGIIDSEINSRIELLTQNEGRTNIAPYSFSKTGIVLNENWISYLKTHQIILRGFINWHLLKFLQKRNPSVIGLSEKLEKPASRDMNQARWYWSVYLQSQSIQCIYSKQLISIGKFSLDHFIPWSYMAHDQLWNIIPTTASVNSSKSNILPSLTSYLAEFCNLQYEAFQFHLRQGNHKIIEDYNIMLSHPDFNLMTRTHFIEKLSQEINNNSRIAANMGFQSPYIYTQTGL